MSEGVGLRVRSVVRGRRPTLGQAASASAGMTHARRSSTRARSPASFPRLDHRGRRARGSGGGETRFGTAGGAPRAPPSSSGGCRGRATGRRPWAGRWGPLRRGTSEGEVRRGARGGARERRREARERGPRGRAPRARRRAHARRGTRAARRPDRPREGKYPSGPRGRRGKRATRDAPAGRVAWVTGPRAAALRRRARGAAAGTGHLCVSCARR